MQILAFGDSITWGAWDLAGGGWADRLKRAAFEYVERAPKETILEVYNLGIPSERTDNFLKRFPQDALPRIETPKENVFLFGFGANDCAFIPSKKEFQCSPEQFEKNYRKILQEAKVLAKRIYLLTITPINEAMCVQTDEARKNEFVEKYNALLQRLALEEGVSTIDIFDAFIKKGISSLLIEDGHHPNTAGHELIFSLVKETLWKDLGMEK
jgi:lysophospholipase L1-like esterase